MHNQGRHYIARGRTLILIGHAGHPEVEGTLGQIDGPTYLVQNEAEIAALPLADDTPIAYVTQTTLSVDDTSALIEALKRRFTDVVGPETRDICYATQNRQSAVRDLARVADLILVVGAKNSSNSNRLREIAEESGVPGYLVADGRQVDPAWLDGVKVVGLTAGASAPEVLVEDVIDALRRIAPVEVSTLDGIEENVRFRLPLELDESDDGACKSSSKRKSIVGIPFRQVAKIGSYIVRQHLTGRKRYPLVLMLEPLFRCNLACAGCGKIDYPDEILNKRISVEDALHAAEECGAPVVSIAGGEPLHPQGAAEDRRRADRAGPLRHRLHQRAPAREEDRRIQAEPLFHLVDPSRRRPGDARPLGLPRRASTTRRSRR